MSEKEGVKVNVGMADGQLVLELEQAEQLLGMFATTTDRFMEAAHAMEQCLVHVNDNWTPLLVQMQAGLEKALSDRQSEST